MSSTKQKQNDIFSRTSIRNALRSWQKLTKLGKHPLAELNIIKSRQEKENYTDTPEGYGLALRAELREIIEQFKPTEAMTEPLPERWAPYIILNEQYLNNRKRKYIEDTYDIAIATYTRWQGKALDRVANTLREREQKWTPEDDAGKTSKPVTDIEVDQRINPSPFLAPPLPSHTLIGRDQMLIGLKRQLFAGHTQNVALFALNGLPGVGKTALAIALAHDKEVQKHFSDGILWVGLGKQPDIGAHLTSWGMALDISPSDMAKFSTTEQQVRAIYTAIGRRRMLLVIDDAWDINQALIFKLGGQNCAHLLTTRHPELAWDFAQQDARAIHELNEADSLALLSSFVSLLVIKYPEEARALVKAVDGLPLALILMGRYLQKAIHLGKADVLPTLLTELKQVQTRLNLTMPQSVLEKQPSLPVGVPISLLASIEISDSMLAEKARQTLRALSILRPKPNTFSQEAALAVSAHSLKELAQLVEAGLIETQGNQRYTMHQVIADYATFKNNDPAPHHRRAATYFANFAQQQSKEGYDNLELEWQNIAHAMQWAYSNQFWQPLLDATQGLTAANLGVMGFMDARGHWNDAKELLEKALEGAQALNNRQAEAQLLSKMGAYAFRQSDRATAEQHLLASLAILEQLPPSEALILEHTHCYEFLARLEMEREPEAAHQWIDSGLTELEGLDSEAARYQKGYFNVLLSELNARTGRLQEGIAVGEKGLALLPTLPTPAKIHGLIVLSNICALQGNLAQSLAYQKEGLLIAQQLGDLRRLADLWMNMALNEGNRGNISIAVEYLHKALTTSRNIHDIDGQRKVHNNLGMFYTLLGQDNDALTHLNKALHFAQNHGLLKGEAYSRTYLADLLIHQGKLTEATLTLKIAEEICINLKLTDRQTSILRLKADIARLKNKNDQALKLVQQSIKAAESSGYLLQKHIAFIIKGKILDAMERFDEAEVTYQASLQMLGDQYPYESAQSRFALGKHYLMRDGHLSQRAKALLIEALTTFERLGAKRDIALTKELLDSA